MECNDIRELLSAYMDDVLDSAEKEAVDKHLVDCAHCRQELADLRKTVDVIKSLGEVVPPEDFHNQLKQRLTVAAQKESIAKRGLQQRVFQLSRMARFRWAAVAAVLILGLGIGLFMDNLFKPMGSTDDVKPLALRAKSDSDNNYGLKEEAQAPGAGSVTAEDSYKIISGNSASDAGEIKEYSPNDSRFKTAQQDDQNPESAGNNNSPMIALENPKSVEPVGAADLEQLTGFGDISASSPDAPTSSVRSFGAALSEDGAALSEDKGTAVQDNQMTNAGSPLLGDQVALAEKEKETDEVKAYSREVVETTKSEKIAETGEVVKAREVAQADTNVVESRDSKGGATPSTRKEEKVTVADKPGSTNPNNSEIIKKAWMSLEVKAFNKASQEINRVAAKYEGYVEKLQEQVQAEGTKTGTFVVRVPVNRFTEALTEYEKVGKVASKELAGEDVSVEYRDAHARLRNLQRQETRLLTLVDKAESLSDVLALENELARIRQEIETIEARINYLSNVTEMATINLDVQEVKEKNSPGAEGVFKRTWNAFIDSCSQLVNFLELAIVFVGKALPYLVVALLMLAGYNYYKKNKKSKE